MWVSDLSLQVCFIPHSRPVFMKVCQHVWREPVLTDIIQVFSLPCIPQTDRQTESLSGKCKFKKKNSSTACCHALVLSCMIYEIGGFTWLLLYVCAQGQMELMHVLPYIYIIPVCSQVAPLLLLVLSSLTNMIHHAMQSNSSKNNPSLSCTG